MLRPVEARGGVLHRAAWSRRNRQATHAGRFVPDQFQEGRTDDQPPLQRGALADGDVRPLRSREHPAAASACRARRGARRRCARRFPRTPPPQRLRRRPARPYRSAPGARAMAWRSRSGAQACPRAPRRHREWRSRQSRLRKYRRLSIEGSLRRALQSMRRESVHRLAVCIGRVPKTPAFCGVPSRVRRTMMPGKSS